MHDPKQLTADLRQRLADADALAERYRRALRRDLLAWIVIAALLGTVVGYGVATALIDPVTVLVPCKEGIRV